jgi:hypothetical protein
VDPDANALLPLLLFIPERQASTIGTPYDESFRLGPVAGNTGRVRKGGKSHGTDTAEDLLQARGTSDLRWADGEMMGRVARDRFGVRPHQPATPSAVSILCPAGPGGFGRQEIIVLAGAAAQVRVWSLDTITWVQVES